MTPEEAFLADIIESPDDDGPRLIYADWLEDHRQAERADFIRVQVELALLLEHGDPSLSPRQAELETRERVLLKSHAGEWAGPLRERAEQWGFHRGFVEAVTLTARAFVRHGEEVLRAAPVREVHLRAAEDLMGTLALSPCLRRLTALDLQGNSIGDEGLGELLASPHLGGLRRLGLCKTRMEPPGLHDLLARADGLPALADLGLDSTFLYEEDFQALADSPLASRLRGLELEGDAEVSWLELFAGSSPFVGLTSLTLSEGSFGDPGCEVLAASARLSALRHLDLRKSWFGDWGVQALAASPHLKGLVGLRLGENHVSSGGVEAIARSSSFPRLRTLALDHNRIREAGVAALVASPLWQRISWLDLHGNPLKDAGARELLAGPFPANMVLLDLRSCGISEDLQRALVEPLGDRVVTR
jgi:uncharacterized protein (TIGR02996 family)